MLDTSRASSCPVSVGVDFSNRLPGLTIVGPPDAAVREERDVVRAAVLWIGPPWPPRRVTVNRAPSRFQKAKQTKPR